MNIKKTSKLLALITAGTALVTSILKDKEKKDDKKH